MAYTNFTNCTKEQYESIIYSEEDTNRIRIWFNNVELLDADEYCESFSGTNRILPDDGNKIFTLDNFVAKNYTLILRDLPEGTIISDQVKVSIGTLVNENNNTYEDVPIGIFNIQDTPTNDKGRVTIKLRDNRVKFDFNYNAQPLIQSLGGTATKKQILEDICNQAGVTNNVSTFNGEDDEIGIYDNTITATTYVSYIFEQAGLMPFINREGQLDKINLNDLKVWRIPLSIVEKYEKGTPFKIERVVYESGIIKYESSNDESLDTLYLNSANPYINNKQQIDNIYNLLVGFSADSVKSGRILGNPAIDPFDMILIYDDEINDNPISTSTGTNLTLQNTPNASTNIDLLGNTTQDTTTGKNLFISSTSSTTTSGMTFTKNSDGSWTLNGTNNSGNIYYLRLNDNFTLQAGTYTLSNSNPNVGTNTAIFYDDAHNFDIDSSYAHNIATKTFTSAVTIKPYIRWNNGATLNNFKIYPMIERGSNYTGFEPYTGTQPSPNPNYPQNVETTTGRNTINVCGKNLANNNFEDYDITDGSYAILPIKLEYGKTYVLKATLVGEQKANYYNFGVVKDGTTYNNFVGLTLCVDYSTGTALQRTFTIDNTYTNPKLVCFIQRSQTKFNELFTNYHIQLEKSSTATTYEPYIGNSYEVNLGKNLFDKDSADIGVAYINSSTGAIINGGDSTTIKYYEVEPNTQYTLTAQNLQRLAFYNSSKTKLLVSTTTNTTFTTPANTMYVAIQLATSTFNVNTIQLEKGNVASSYSPYFEPIELCKIGTYQDRLFKASGKNLFDEKNILNASGWTYSNGYYTGTANSLRSYFNNTTMYSFKTNTRYTFSWKGYLGTATNLRVRITYTDSSTQESAYITSTTLTSSSITSQTNKTISSITINYSDGGTIFLKELQLEENTTATSYEPYGNYWYKYNAIGKVVLNGSESWTIYNSGTQNWYYSNINSNIDIINDSTTTNSMSNYYQINAVGNSNTNQGMYIVKTSKQIRIRYGTEDTTTNFKTWLGTHNTLVYYVLATPTYTKIENDELIGQLNRLKTIQTIEGTTNIQQNNSSEPFELNVEYFNESYILKTLANNTYKYTGINRNEFNTEISLEQRKENVSIKSEATYQKIAKTEIDATNASINMITEELGFVDGNSQVIESIKTTQTQNSLDIEAITSYQEIDGKQVLTGVKTGKGFTFNNSGLIIRDANEENTYKTKIDETGTFYYDDETILGQTTNEGSKFKNMELFGEFRYGKDNIDDPTSLFVSMKFKETNNNVEEECFGHFWNGD